MSDIELGRRAVLAIMAGAGAAAASGPTSGQPALKVPPLPTELAPAWRQAEALSLWPKGAPDAGDFRPTPLPANYPPVFLRNTLNPQLHLFRPKSSNRRALLVMPGGSYEFVSVANEGLDVAARACPLGYTVFVLNYRLPSEGWRDRPNAPLQDAQRAMRLLRSWAGRYGVDADKIAVLGFSAGGHLAASLATGFSEPVYAPLDDADRVEGRPSAAALIYPVITMTEPYTHAVSRQRLLGAAPSGALIAAHSPEEHVSSGTPPIFLAHAIDDPAVPVENSLMMMSAARAAKRPVEAHFFQEGGHAFGVGWPGTPSSDWMSLLDLWLGRTFSAA